MLTRHGKGKVMRTECEADSLIDEGALFGASGLLNHGASERAVKVLEPSTVVVHGTGALLLVLKPEAYSAMEPSCVELIRTLRDQKVQWRNQVSFEIPA